MWSNMTKSMEMWPPLSITKLTSPTFAIGANKSSKMPAKKRRTRLSSARYPEIENRLKTWIVNHGNSGFRLTVKALRQEALSIAETI